MGNHAEVFAEGGCDCNELRYCLLDKPIIVHCCHCRWCQRETGTAFALNAMYEADRIQLASGTTEVIDTPSESGKGQKIVRCPRCRIAVWSHYAGAGEKIGLIRVGTLDNPDLMPPDVHIFTDSKQPWVLLPANTPSFPEYYRRSEVWSEEALERRKAALA